MARIFGASRSGVKHGPQRAPGALLMAGAVAMHLRVGDPFKKSVPTPGLLLLCGVIIAGTLVG